MVGVLARLPNRAVRKLHQHRAEVQLDLQSARSTPGGLQYLVFQPR
jgi:hypothetical protein